MESLERLRIKPKRPLSAMQSVVATLLGIGTSIEEIARELHVSVACVRGHIKSGAQKLPGDLPAAARLMVWARGGTREQLTGWALKGIIMDQGREAMRQFEEQARREREQDEREQSRQRGKALASSVEGTNTLELASR